MRSMMPNSNLMWSRIMVPAEFWCTGEENTITLWNMGAADRLITCISANERKITYEAAEKAGASGPKSQVNMKCPKPEVITKRSTGRRAEIAKSSTRPENDQNHKEFAHGNPMLEMFLRFWDPWNNPRKPIMTSFESLQLWYYTDTNSAHYTAKLRWWTEINHTGRFNLKFAFCMKNR